MNRAERLQPQQARVSTQVQPCGSVMIPKGEIPVLHDVFQAPAGANGSVPSTPVKALLADAVAHYQAGLRSSPEAVSYLRNRGITGAGAARFGLGYAVPQWHGLAPVLSKYNKEYALASGLLVTSDGAPSRQFDRFRGRIMFPIRDRIGGVVGFGGRVVQDSERPKYMNSPEGVHFQKRNLVFGLYEAQEAIAAEGLGLVVEGYFDVVMLSQAGFVPAVGTLGTACTSRQIEQLLSVAPRVVFCFDGDAAGRRAAARALEVSLEFATDAHRFDFVFLPADHDPDSFVRKHGIGAFRALITAALPLSDFIQQVISQGCNFDHAEGRSLCVARAKPYWRALPDGTARETLLNFCAGVSRLQNAELLHLWKSAQ